MFEEIGDDDGGFVAYVCAEVDEDEPYNDPTHWHENENGAADPKCAYVYWGSDGEWKNFAAYILGGTIYSDGKNEHTK